MSLHSLCHHQVQNIIIGLLDSHTALLSRVVFLKNKSDHATLLPKSSSASPVPSEWSSNALPWATRPPSPFSFWSLSHFYLTWASGHHIHIPCNVLDPIPTWATLSPSLRLSEGINFQEAFSLSPVPVEMWPTYILPFTPVMQCHVTCQSKEFLADTYTSFLLLNLQFSGLIKAMNGIYFSLLASVHLYNNGFLFLQNKIIPRPLSVSRVSDSIAPMPVNCCRIVESLWFGFESWLCHSCVILHNLLNISEPQSLICKTGIVIPIQDWYEKD